MTPQNLRSSTLATWLLFAALAAVPFIAQALEQPFWTSFFARILI
jgi:branched-chain amino acid transport system permease protein